MKKGLFVVSCSLKRQSAAESPKAPRNGQLAALRNQANRAAFPPRGSPRKYCIDVAPTKGLSEIPTALSAFLVR